MTSRNAAIVKAFLWVLIVALWALSTVSHSRPIVMGLIFPLMAFTLGYTFNLIRTRVFAVAVVLVAFLIWLVVFLIEPTIFA